MVFNFNAGPAVLPREVLLRAQEELLDFQSSGISILESSHRSKEYIAVQEEAEANLRKLLNIPEEYSVLFLQGGATQQFAMVPMNLLGPDATADYTNSGSWAKKAIGEAKKVGNISVIADTNADRPTRMPRPDEWNTTPGAAYLHITSNETISGAQWKTFPESEAPLVADMSSDILSRSVDVSRFGVIYAGAQKNLGPSGVTVVIIRKDLAERAPESLPNIFRYQTHVDARSMYNTPPCFSVYLLMLVTRWLEERGVSDAWELTSTLVNLEFDTDGLATLAKTFHADQLTTVIAHVNSTYTAYNLLAEIGQGAGRISEIVKALKSYSFLDQAPTQAVDIHDGLDNTLLILRSKLKDGISVRREYGPDVPKIEAFGSELNQVWTNILDNAIDALDGKGEITVRTRREGEWVVTEIADNGPGIPSEIQSKIFDAFFTTKAPGHGTGLGLDISYNIVVYKHRGDIKVVSEPGKTSFSVWLPINFGAK